MSIKFPEPVVLTAEVASERLDKAAHRVLGISGLEFLVRWDAGEYQEDDSAGIAELSALIRFVR